MKKKICAFLLLAAVIPLAAVLCSCQTGEAADKRDLYVISASFDGDRTLTANEKVYAENRTDGALSRIYFHLYPRAYEEDAQFKACENIISPGSLEITGVSLSVPGSYEIEGEDEDLLAVIPDSPVLPEEKIRIEIEFTLVLPQTDHRLGVNSLGVASFGNWYPVLCADKDTSPYYAYGDPFVSETADYEVSVSLPDDLSVVMTGEERVQSSGNGRKSVSSSAANVRDFAFLAGKFNKSAVKSGKTTVSYYYIKDDDAKGSLSAAVDALATFSRLFGEYPYGDYDVVQSMPGSGGMEYPCLSMISAANNRSLYIEAIIHETAHQWWYSLVGSNQIENAWLDEGLAEYSATLFYEKNPAYGVTAEARIADASASYLIYLDITLEKTHSMNRRLPDFLSAADYSYISYVKGELFFHSLRQLIGDGAFFGGLKTYVAENSGRIAYPDCLIAAMEKNSQKPLKSYCDGWINGADVVAK